MELVIYFFVNRQKNYIEYMKQHLNSSLNTENTLNKNRNIVNICAAIKKKDQESDVENIWLRLWEESKG